MYKAAIFLMGIFLLILFGCSSERATQTGPEGTTHKAVQSDQVLELLDQYKDIETLGAADVCDHGTLEGVWIRNSIFSDDGTFHGHWIGRDSTINAYYDGWYWTTTDYTRLFYGQLSDYITDEVLGYMFGTWFYDDPRLCPMCGTGHGQFEGYFIYNNEPGVGIVHGEFGWAGDLMQDTLPMTGTWKWRCLMKVSEFD